MLSVLEKFLFPMWAHNGSFTVDSPPGVISGNNVNWLLFTGSSHPASVIVEQLFSR